MRQETLKLLGYQRAEHQLAENRHSLAAKLEIVILAIAVGALAVPDGQYALIAALASLLLGVGWRILLRLGQRSHYVAERARRAVILDVGLGIGLSGKAYSDLFSAFSATESSAKKHEDEHFYATSKPVGPDRLADILEQSAFWSKHLFRISTIRSLTLLVVFFVAAVTCLILLAISTSTSASVLGAHSVCVILAWFVTGSVLTNVLAFWGASKEIDDVEGRLANVSGTTEELLLVLGDYNAAVQSAPTIPTSTYLRNRSRLNDLWDSRSGTHSTAAIEP